MNSIFVFIVIFLAFFCGDNVLEILGYPHHDFTASILFRLHPLTYLASFILFYFLMTSQLKVSVLIDQMKNELIFLFICFITICYLQLTGNLSAFSFFLDALVLPPILSIILKLTDKKILHNFRNLIYISFFLNAFVAVIEKAKGTNLIVHESAWQFDYFRSSAIFGHPLNNGLIMAVLTVVLFWGTKNNWLKLNVLFWGVLSILCFGARAALISVFIGIILNVVLNAFGFGKEKVNKHIISGLCYLALFALLIVFFTSYTGLGDRIAALAHIDNSAEARVDSYNVLNGIQFNELLWGGYDTGQIDYLQYLSGVEIIENFYIVWALKFGLVITILLLIFLFKFLYSLMHKTARDIKLPILCTLFLVASTNNSLATNTLVISMLVLAYYILFECGEESDVYSNLAIS